MNELLKNGRGFIIVIFLLALVPASGCGLVRPYKCNSDFEQNIFNIASRNIHPDDVRVMPKEYLHNAVVAWAGTIIECTISEKEDEADARLLVEHHHFDWLEDFKLGENIFILSARGEGSFKTVWPLRLDYGMEELKRWTAKGNMVVIYGMPVSVENGIIELEANCVRFILPGRFKFADIPYGRDAGWQY